MAGENAAIGAAIDLIDAWFLLVQIGGADDLCNSDFSSRSISRG